MTTQRYRTIFSALTLSLALTTVAACKSEIDEKPKAKVEDAEEPAKAEGEADKPAEGEADKPTEGKTFKLTAEGSSVGFIGAKVTRDHKGSFGSFEGSAVIDGGKVTAMELTVSVGSMTTDADPDLSGHLAGPDFFNAAEFPQAKFTSLSISEKAGEGGATHEVAGNLELRGQVKKVTFPATIELSDTAAHGKAEFSIDRKLWGITYPGKPDDLIKDEVALILDLNFAPG